MVKAFGPKRGGDGLLPPPDAKVAKGEGVSIKGSGKKDPPQGLLPTVKRASIVS